MTPIVVEHEHPDPCTAARCRVPAALEVVIASIDNAVGGRRFQQRICLGHYLAFKLFAHGRLDVQVMTVDEVMAERRRRDVRVEPQTTHVYFGPTTTTSSTFSWQYWAPTGF